MKVLWTGELCGASLMEEDEPSLSQGLEMQLLLILFWGHSIWKPNLPLKVQVFFPQLISPLPGALKYLSDDTELLG